MCWSKSMPLASTNSTPRRFNPGDEVYARPDKDGGFHSEALADG